jgi:hypothetical protein
MAKKSTSKTVETLRHDEAKRKNIPTARFHVCIGTIDAVNIGGPTSDSMIKTFLALNDARRPWPPKERPAHARSSLRLRPG